MVRYLAVKSGNRFSDCLRTGSSRSPAGRQGGVSLRLQAGASFTARRRQSYPTNSLLDQANYVSLTAQSSSSRSVSAPKKNILS